MPAIAVIGNPTARGFARGVDAVLREAARSGADARVLPTEQDAPGGPQTLEALRAGADAVVAVGGDGTVREVAAVLARTGVPLGIVPSGTANLFARNLDLPLRDVTAAARAAVSGAASDVDLGRVVLSRSGAREEERPFLVVVGVGHDALAVEAASLLAKRRLGWTSYIAAGLGRLGHPSFAVRGRFDGGPIESTRAWSVLVHNAARIPAGLSVLPGTRLDDGSLHVATVSPRHLAHWGRIAAAGAGIARAEGVLRHRTVERVTLGAVDAPLPVQIDGDAAKPVDRLDARIDRAALSVRMPGSRA
ncbi:diacylglycerol/lipid kinase family protein [Agrococcus sp. TSP3-2-1]|uniref:diacylglycerol/lipid kinase family protein n=1 Tax=Agrococcus sp. TSP3-2-1 TaxID=2804583 RepID=UPI003CE8EB36